MNVCLIQKGRPICALVGLAFLLFAILAPAARAADVDSCDEDSFLVAVQSGDDTVTFTEDCTITLSATVPITGALTIDAQGHSVTIEGGGTNLLFDVAGATFQLVGINLVNGSNTNGGALY